MISVKLSSCFNKMVYNKSKSEIRSNWQSISLQTVQIRVFQTSKILVLLSRLIIQIWEQNHLQLLHLYKEETLMTEFAETQA